MCFSEKASLVTLLVGLTSSAFVYSLGSPTDKIWGLMFAFVSLMQLVEYLLWRHQVCDVYNKMISFLGKFLNLMQPIVLLLLVVYFKGAPSSKTLYVIVGLYLAFIMKYNSWNIKEQQCIIKGSDGHLHYPWSKFNIVSHSVFVATLTAVAYYSGFSWSPYIVPITYLISFIFYGPINLVGEMWCIMSVFLPIFYYLKYKY